MNAISTLPPSSWTITATHAGPREVDGVNFLELKLIFDCGSERSVEPDLESMDSGEGVGQVEIKQTEVEDGVIQISVNSTKS